MTAAQLQAPATRLVVTWRRLKKLAMLVAGPEHLRQLDLAVIND